MPNTVQFAHRISKAARPVKASTGKLDSALSFSSLIDGTAGTGEAKQWASETIHVTSPQRGGVLFFSAAPRTRTSARLPKRDLEDVRVLNPADVSSH